MRKNSTGPIITLIDTPGAYPGIDAEERGQAEAIAYNLREMSRLRCPVIAVIIGEGGSGGALAIGVANRVYMLENAYYSVISPESCAAIIWRDSGKARACCRGAEVNSSGSAAASDHRRHCAGTGRRRTEDVEAASASLRETLKKALAELAGVSREQLISDRYEKFRAHGELLPRGDALKKFGLIIVFVIAMAALIAYSTSRATGREVQSEDLHGIQWPDRMQNCQRRFGNGRAPHRPLKARAPISLRGVTETVNCQNTSPHSVSWLKRP